MFDIQQNTTWLLKLLDSCGVSKNEFLYRKKALEGEHMRGGSVINDVSDRYYNLAHEIKSFKYLTQFGNVNISKDCSHQPGCDCILNSRYQIECVCSSAGKHANKTGLEQLCLKNNINKIVDYGAKKELLYCRLTSSIYAKQKFFETHVEDETISPRSPYLIFLGLGALSYELFAGDYGIEFTSILIGKGDPVFSIDIKTGRTIRSGYTHNSEIVNHNGAKINFDIFCSETYKCLSGVIISQADLNEEYTVDNTWMFLNPNADVKICPGDFRNMVYWDLYGDDEYGPYVNGNRIVTD